MILLTENYIDFCICVNKPIISDAGGSSLIDARWGHLHTIWTEEPFPGKSIRFRLALKMCYSSTFNRVLNCI